MKVTADTNVLLRLVMRDDKIQNRISVEVLQSASVVAISVHSLCELVWVLGAKQAMARDRIATSIRRLIGAKNVVVNRAAVEAGLAVLDAGGNFADGVIAFEGQWLGAETLISFDKAAVKILNAQSIPARLLS